MEMSAIAGSNPAPTTKAFGVTKNMVGHYE